VVIVALRVVEGRVAAIGSDQVEVLGGVSWQRAVVELLGEAGIPALDERDRDCQTGSTAIRGALPVGGPCGTL
jgi:hypothetical protein